MEIEYEETVGTDDEQLKELPQEVSVTQKCKFIFYYNYQLIDSFDLQAVLTPTVPQAVHYWSSCW